MADKTKTIEIYEFYYPDRRPDSQSAFYANAIVVDPERGDKLIQPEFSTSGGYHFLQGNGRKIVVTPGWLWVESYTQVVKVKDKIPA